MKTVLFYLLQVIIASGILYGYYHLMLRNKKFHQYNRFYLLGAAIISVLIPFLNIPVYFAESEIQSSVVLQTLQSISSADPENEGIITAEAPEIATRFNWNIVLYSIYAFAVVFFIVRILISLKKIRTIIKRNPVEELEGVRFVNTIEPGTPYSFFRWLFWNKKIELRSGKGEQIFRHEIYHIQQKHSLDILIMELLTAFLWVNPFFHLIKKEIKAIHEFLADRFAAHKTEKWEYAELLLMQALNTQQHLVNPFFHNQIKRRIAMITNPKKTSHRYLRKLLVLPVAAIVVALFAFSYQKKQMNDNVFEQGNPITIVIDAAHGGTDAGVMSPDNKYSEAQIALEIAQQIQKLAKEYNINVVMTREDDKFPGNAANKEDGLRKRIEIANKIKPDAFIAIHVNVYGNPNNGNQTKYSGFEAYVSDKREDANGRLLASAVLNNLSPVYKTSLELKQRKEQGVYVLDHNSYPAVLLECGYINNSEDLSFIINKGNQEKMAKSILGAIVSYNKSVTTPDEVSGIEKPVKSPAINGTVEIADIDATNSRQPSKIIINGKEFTINEVKIEGLENSKIVTADFRMATDLTGSDTTYPLFVIDGVKQGRNSRLSDIDPASIESLNVLKGQTAMTKYGKDGKNGVIEIITKSAANVKVKETTLQEKKSENANIVFEKAEIDPSFPGGEIAWKKYLERNLDASVAAQNNAPAGEYTVFVHFVVRKDGSIYDVKALTNHGYGMETEAIRMIKKGPDWLPAIQNGKTVNAYKKQRVDFGVPKVSMLKSKQTSKIKEIEPQSQHQDIISYQKTAIDPSFPGGEEAFKKYVKANQKEYRVPLSNTKSAGSMKNITIGVVVEFIVDIDGSVSDVKTDATDVIGIGKDAVDLIRKGPKWNPAIQNGIPVKATKKQEIKFVAKAFNQANDEKT